MEHTGYNKPYLERNFIRPSYIGKNGEANIENISSSLGNISKRNYRLAADKVLKTKAAPTANFDPEKAPDPLDFSSKATNPNIQTVELPLISDVWNGSEPINYVCDEQ